MDKRAFLVLGPESSGTRLMTRLLIAAGCEGDDWHEQRWDNVFPDPEENPLIVWRRSLPHGNEHEWPDVERLFRALRDTHGLIVIVMSRDWHSMIASQSQSHTDGDRARALGNIRDAYTTIFTALDMWQYQLNIQWEVVNYEAITQRPEQTVTRLFQRLGLPAPDALPYLYDGNAKYYREAQRVS